MTVLSSLGSLPTGLALMLLEELQCPPCIIEQIKDPDLDFILPLNVTYFIIPLYLIRALLLLSEA